MKKRIAAVIMAAVMTLSASITAFAGVWQNLDGDWYFTDPSISRDDNDFITGWQWIDGYCYYFDPDEGGAMAVTKVTPDGFPVNEVGRMTNMQGEPYYIEGWGLTASTLGPGDYSGYYDPDIIYGGSQDDYLHDLWELLERMLRGGREPEEPRQKAPDTVVVQIEVVGGQPDKIQDPPEDPVLKVGENAGKPETDLKQPENNQTETPIVWPQGGQTRSGESASKSGNSEEKPGQGNAAGSIGAMPNMNLPGLGH